MFVPVKMFHVAIGALLLSALSLQGCSKAPTQPASQTTAAIATSSNAAMVRYFTRVISKYSNLSAQEWDAKFVDRDIKGNIIAGSIEGTQVTEPWAHKDLEKDTLPGTSTERAYKELNLKSTGAPVVVAVIDTTIDIEHEDLKENIWTNDQTDDVWPGAVHGWNFLGGKNGKIYHTTLEVTRELKRMRALKEQQPLTSPQQAYLDKLEIDYVEGKGDAAKKVEMRKAGYDSLSAALEILRAKQLIDTGSYDEVSAIQSEDPAVIAARDAALLLLAGGRDLAWYKSSMEHWMEAVKLNDQYYYNLDFDPSGIVGDDPNQLVEVYGNADLKPIGPEESHGTHVAGIIGALRNNQIGMDGQAENVRIMALRAVPDGDERDKDIGNAIRFAVDHGARVINMSLGKNYSPQRQFVWDMIRYAASKEVLVVHAAGNSSLNNDIVTHYPDREVRDENGELIEILPNFINVGASSSHRDKNLPATFSNFGNRTVDLFAPGVQIYSSVPEQGYAEMNGTSMATPEVAGVAALVLSQYPHLTAAQLKDLLIQSADPTFKNLMVLLPGAFPGAPLVEFSSLSQTGGIVNAYRALKAAGLLQF